MRYDSRYLPLLVIVSLVVFFTRWGLLGAVIINKPNGSTPISLAAQARGWPRAIADEINSREKSLAIGYGGHWDYDYGGMAITALKLDWWSHRPLLTHLFVFGRDRFSIVRINMTAVVLLPPLRLLMLTLWWHLAGKWWRQWQRERWHNEDITA